MTEPKDAGCYKPCTACGVDVHNRASACKACGAKSPWPAPARNKVASATPAKAAKEKPQAKADKKAKKEAQAPVVQKTSTAPVTPQAVIEEAPGLPPHIVLTDFHQIVGDVMVRLPAKRIITDQRLIRKLLETKAPIIAVGSEGDVTVCPCCKHIFSKVKGGGNAVA